MISLFKMANTASYLVLKNNPKPRRSPAHGADE